MAERAHTGLALVAAAIVIAAVVEWRALRPPKVAATPAPASATVPSAQLRQLMPFSAPVTDSQLAVSAWRDSIALRRDPFGVDVPVRASEPRASAASHVVAAPDSTIPWRVSATLISSARRAAIINDVLTYVGDRVPGGGKLVSVERDRIVLIDSKGASHTVIAEKEGT